MRINVLIKKGKFNMSLVMGLPPFKIILLITNVLMICLLLSIMLEHYKSNNNIRSWSSLFYLLCLIWLSIRGIFWLLTVTSTTFWLEPYFELLYWMPNPLQFGSFLLLPLFFAQIVHRGKWEQYWVYVRPVYITVIACIVLFQLIYALLAFHVSYNTVSFHCICL